MNWINHIQNCIDYIENHLTDKIDYKVLEKQECFSFYNIQKAFSLICGISIGEYVRKRRLTLAGNDLKNKKNKVIDVALKYEYDTPESFSRAFKSFHGIPPSKVNDFSVLNSFSRLNVKLELSESPELSYEIKELPQIKLVGYKKRFTGIPYGKERDNQEREFFTTTRAKQWLLLGASCDYSTDYVVINNVCDDGYDCYVAYELDEPTISDLLNPEVTGVDFIGKMNFKIITIPAHKYASFKTEKKKRPVADYGALRKNIVNEWLITHNVTFTNTPEIVKFHWRPNGEWSKERYIEILIPIE